MIRFSLVLSGRASKSAMSRASLGSWAEAIVTMDALARPMAVAATTPRRRERKSGIRDMIFLRERGRLKIAHCLEVHRRFVAILCGEGANRVIASRGTP